MVLEAALGAARAARGRRGGGALDHRRRPRRVAGQPDEDASAATIVAHYEENSGALLGGGFVFMLGSAVFLWFLGSLRDRLFSAEGRGGRVTAILFAAGVAVAVLTAASQAPHVAGAITADETERALEPAPRRRSGGSGTGSLSPRRRWSRSSSSPQPPRSCAPGCSQRGLAGWP